MAGLVKLAIDRQSKTLVEFNGSVTDLPPVYQLNQQQFQIQIVESTGDLFEPFTVVDCSACELRMVLAATITGDESDNSGLLLAAAYEAAWTWDVGEEAFLGTINFHTAEVSTYIGSDAYKAVILEINLLTGAIPETVFGSRSGNANIVINANADDGSATAPSIIEQAETVGIFTIQDSVGGVTVAATLVTITGLALAGAPSAVYIWVICPNGSGFIGGNFEDGSASADGFSVRLSAVPPNNNYKISYVLTF